PRAVESEQAADRSHERPFPGPPAHGLRKGELADYPGNGLREDVDRVAARDPTPDRDRSTPRGVDYFELRNVDLLRPGDAFRRPRRLPVPSEGRRSGRSEHLAFRVGLPLRDPARPDDEAPGRSIRLDRLGGDPLLLERFADAPREIAPRPGQRRRRDFFGADLEEEVVAFHAERGRRCILAGNRMVPVRREGRFRRRSRARARWPKPESPRGSRPRRGRTRTRDRGRAG